jgi:ABC-type uncharacterized transport system permease subunit
MNIMDIFLSALEVKIMEKEGNFLVECLKFIALMVVGILGLVVLFIGIAYYFGS